MPIQSRDARRQLAAAIHFRGDGGRWRDARGGGELGATLSAILREQAGLAVAFGDLAAPDSSG